MTCRLVLATYWRQASSTVSIGYLRVTGIVRRRMALFGAWSEMARLICSGSSASRRMPGTSADGRDRHVPRADVQSFGHVEDAQRVQRVLVVVQRLAHAHEDEVGDVVDARAVGRLPRFAAQFAGEVQHLGDDLAGGEVAVEAHLPRRAEGAAIGAARLGRDADRRAGAALAAGGIEHQHRLDQATVGQLQQNLARAPVFRGEFGAARMDPRCSPRAQVARAAAFGSVRMAAKSSTSES